MPGMPRMSHPHWSKKGNPTPDLADMQHLQFEDALNDTFALSELAMDMVESFACRDELIWIQNGFKPARKGDRVKRKQSDQYS